MSLLCHSLFFSLRVLILFEFFLPFQHLLSHLLIILFPFLLEDPVGSIINSCGSTGANLIQNAQRRTSQFCSIFHSPRHAN